MIAVTRIDTSLAHHPVGNREDRRANVDRNNSLAQDLVYFTMRLSLPFALKVLYLPHR